MSICFLSGNLQEDDENAKIQNNKINKEIEADRRKSARVIKLLLLGAGESGKSTIFKQMKIIHKKGYDENECLKFKDIINGNIIQNVRVLIKAMQELKIPYENPNLLASFTEEILSIPEHQILLNASSLMTPQLSKNIAAIWQDKGVQQCYEKRAEYQLNDSAE